MPDLSLWRWQEYAPALGNNLSLPKADQFTLRVKAGVSKAQFERLLAFLRERAADDVARKEARQRGEEVPAENHQDAWAVALGEWIEFGPNPLSIEGQPITTLKELMALARDQVNAELFGELLGVVTTFNTVSGTTSFRSGPRSGGRGTTPPEDEKTDAAESSTRNGNATSG